MTGTEILFAIYQERERQEALHPGQTCAYPIQSVTKTTILMEEVGEVARAVLENDNTQLRKELVEVAAVAVAWLESL
jgi:NTP pyrophosphatase (non-canonical NTP hydrolase)